MNLMKHYISFTYVKIYDKCDMIKQNHGHAACVCTKASLHYNPCIYLETQRNSWKQIQMANSIVRQWHTH